MSYWLAHVHQPYAFACIEEQNFQLVAIIRLSILAFSILYTCQDWHHIISYWPETAIRHPEILAPALSAHDCMKAPCVLPGG